MPSLKLSLVIRTRSCQYGKEITQRRAYFSKCPETCNKCSDLYLRTAQSVGLPKRKSRSLDRYQNDLLKFLLIEIIGSCCYGKQNTHYCANFDIKRVEIWGQVANISACTRNPVRCTKRASRLVNRHLRAIYGHVSGQSISKL